MSGILLLQQRIQDLTAEVEKYSKCKETDYESEIKHEIEYNKLIEEYNLEENGRLKLITDDGRTYLNRNTKKYDAILNDAFSGETPAKTLTTIENVQRININTIISYIYKAFAVSIRCSSSCFKSSSFQSTPLCASAKLHPCIRPKKGWLL